MLRIHKSQSTKKLFFLVITSICGVGAFLGFSALTYTPELSHANEAVSYDTRTLMDITSMQEMSRRICQNSNEHDSKRLMDIRDGKYYWVTKLKDNNCWMTQNLDLDISADGLKASDTDIDVDWNAETNPTYPPVTTQKTEEPNFTTNDTQGDNLIASFDPGEKYCENGVYSQQCDLTSSKKQEHDAVGNYYTWNAATAGYGAAISGNGINSEHSICPKNWKLPTGEPYYGQFYNLFKSYGWIYNANSGSSSGNLSGEVAGITYSIDASPLYFTYSGVITYLNPRHVTEGGVTGNYHSSTTAVGLYGSLDIRYLGIINNDKDNNKWLYPSAQDSYRRNGNSIRCVARDDYDNNVEVEIRPTIVIDVVDEANFEAELGQLVVDSVKVNVKSNQGYSVGLKTESGKTALSSETTTATIPTSTTVRAGRNGWGMKKKISATDSTKLGDDTDSTAYSRLTSTSTVYYQSAGAEVKDLFFTVGIGTASDLPSGIYSTKLIVTAVQN